MPDEPTNLTQPVLAHLLGQRDERGLWVGRLASSALATAVSAFALHRHGQHPHLVTHAIQWLRDHRNSDAGWGDTPDSVSNLPTTALAWATLQALTGREPAAESWLRQHVGSVEPAELARAIADLYGADRTFSVPILTMLALAGALGPDGWRHVPALPYELALLPRQMFARLGLPVVSYALPALIAMGQVGQHHGRTGSPLRAWLRRRAWKPTGRLLAQLQPTSGGFLEATPLTAFVVMSLLASDQREHPVVQRGIDFLARSFRPDGGVPIDTNLATWLTTLSINALAHAGQLHQHLSSAERDHLTNWLLMQQGHTRHPYTDAAPGGWAWTDLPGGVPDADDTSGALLALHALGCRDRRAGAAGVAWLLDLQNRDGGMPTFCRGWGRFPFDRSSTDLTAHALRAWRAWRAELPLNFQRRIDRATAKAWAYLRRQQHTDGSFWPLWFGNQHHPQQANPLYGSVKVLRAAWDDPAAPAGLAARTQAWLMQQQNADGGWGAQAGCPSSVEETALALTALPQDHAGRPAALAWLHEHTHAGTVFPSAPLGFYFASLWYSEALYPVIFLTEALG